MVVQSLFISKIIDTSLVSVSPYCNSTGVISNNLCAQGHCNSPPKQRKWNQILILWVHSSSTLVENFWFNRSKLVEEIQDQQT